MRWTIGLSAGALLALGACSPTSSSEQTMTLHTTQELAADPKLFAEVDAQCNQWKGSQKSPLAFPAAVINTCNNLDSARMQKIHERDIQALREAAGTGNARKAPAARR